MKKSAPLSRSLWPLVPPVKDEEVWAWVRLVMRVIRGERRRQGLPQAELARRAGITRPALTLLENGAREPGLAMLMRLGEGLGGLAELMVRVNRVWPRYCSRLGLGE